MITKAEVSYSRNGGLTWEPIPIDSCRELKTPEGTVEIIVSDWIDYEYNPSGPDHEQQFHFEMEIINDKTGS